MRPSAAVFLIVTLLAIPLPSQCEESASASATAYWHVTRLYKSRPYKGVPSFEWSFEGAGVTVEKAAANSICSTCKRYHPLVLTQFHKLPLENTTVTSIKSLGWGSGNKTRFCQSRGYTSVVPASIVGGEYGDGGWCFLGTRTFAENLVKKNKNRNGAFTSHKVDQVESCGLFTAYAKFRRTKTEQYLVPGYGQSVDAATIAAERMKEKLRINSSSETELLEVEVTGDCQSCTQADIRALGWNGGNKTEFCEKLGFSGVFPHPSGYENGGACFIGPACASVGRYYPVR